MPFKQVKTTTQIRSTDLKRRYGISIAEYDVMLVKQNGRCAICGGKETGRGKNLHVDHDHSDQRVRGLLCARCNQAIGMAGDDPGLLRRMADYLESA